MADELGPDEHIEEFVSGRTKNYAYKTMNALTLQRKTDCKARGITLNYAGAQLINFDSIRNNSARQCH
jgi:hypothetical protein